MGVCRYRYGLGFSNPSPTHTCAAGTAGFVMYLFTDYIIYYYLILFDSQHSGAHCLRAFMEAIGCFPGSCEVGKIEINRNLN